eukprot:CAMPEP_0196573498 /NCGR_PEP_ID=MMETSP1081-20130531/3396_1 /TAXON_ID=36882 /ORGANISM="Pyramimonas amylifera, Strain CCMP720" /LENGTH=424 /DNA_ID=CAMNT_0041891235 /DNA_START=174 /DNA_END=1448 /DNA_ORIENTATION=-
MSIDRDSLFSSNHMKRRRKSGSHLDSLSSFALRFKRHLRLQTPNSLNRSKEVVLQSQNVKPSAEVLQRNVPISQYTELNGLTVRSLTSMHGSIEHASIPKNGLNGNFVLEEGKSTSELCTWKIGGPARYTSIARDQKTMLELVKFSFLHGLDFLVVGKGSNLLFDDKGFDGVVVVNRICFVQELPIAQLSTSTEPQSAGTYRVRAGGGMPFDGLGWHTARRHWSGLEFASGIPGTVGGAVFMNAGANGQCVWDRLVSVEFVTLDGRLHEWKAERGELGPSRYRWSPFQEMKDLAAITAATFELEHGPDAPKTVKDMYRRRKDSQPLKYRTAGCVFRNPDDPELPSAGALIDQAGLKGFTVGGAAVSDIHANFFINEKGNTTTAAELQALIGTVKDVILRQTGYELEEEIRKIPFQRQQKDDSET